VVAVQFVRVVGDRRGAMRLLYDVVSSRSRLVILMEPSYGRSFVPRGGRPPGNALERLPAQRVPPGSRSRVPADSARLVAPDAARLVPHDSYRLGIVQPPPRVHPSAHRAPATGRGWRWLLVIPISMPLLIPIYNRVEPELWGMPFFYWYQLGSAVVAIVVTTLVFLLTRKPG